MATAKQLDAMKECSICTEVYTDPRVLPCGHTFCLKCMETWSKDKQPGDDLSCPLCRKEFAVPSNGVGDLPRNFFVVNFLQMKKSSNVETETGSRCEACSEKGVATVHCVECQQKLCRNCESYHKIFKTTASHQMTKLGEESNTENLGRPNLLSFRNCNKHKADQLRIYCQKCKVAICSMCYIESHNSHKWSDIGPVADDFREQMTSDIDNVAAAADKCGDMLQRLENEKGEFIEQVAKAEMAIGEKAEQLKQMIDVHKEKLMHELSLMKQKRMKEIESVREEIERQLLSMESYKKHVDEVRQKGTACDIAGAAIDLHHRADKLLMLDVIERTLADLGHADVTFTSSDIIVNDVNRTLGQLKLCTHDVVLTSLNLNTAKAAVKSTDRPKLTHVIRCASRSGGVSAMASLGDDVFVLSGQQVLVYDAETFTLKRHITVTGLGNNSLGLAACGRHKCIYVSDRGHYSVHRADLGGSSAVKSWSVANDPRGLSVNNAHNLVVACCTANKLQEYTTHGILVREIILQAGVTSPWHAVQLSSGHYVVSQCKSPGVVAIVGIDGQGRCTYGQSQTADVGEIQCPRSLAVTKNDHILIADPFGGRILSVNSSLSSMRELALPVDGELQEPLGLCLDESRSRLYVGERFGTCRLLVFDVAL